MATTRRKNEMAETEPEPVAEPMPEPPAEPMPEPPAEPMATDDLVTVRVNPAVWRWRDIMAANSVWSTTPSIISAHDERLPELRACPLLIVE